MCMFVFYTCLFFAVFLLTSNFFYITDNHLTLNRMKSVSQSAKSLILRDMTAKNHQKHYKQNQKLNYKNVYTKGICPEDRSFLCRSTDIVQTYIGITQKEWNITQI